MTIKPTLTYSCESWKTAQKQKTTLKGMEMRFLRRTDDKKRKEIKLETRCSESTC